MEHRSRTRLRRCHQEAPADAGARTVKRILLFATANPVPRVASRLANVFPRVTCLPPGDRPALGEVGLLGILEGHVLLRSRVFPAVPIGGLVVAECLALVVIRSEERRVGEE